MYKFKTSDGKLFKVSDLKEFRTDRIGDINATVAVNESSVIRAVPTNFVGFSMEHNWCCDFITNVTPGSKIENMLLNLGQSIIRYGGNSGDRTLWDPNGASSCGTPTCSICNTFNRILISNLFSIINRIGWKVTWQINLVANDPTLYADEADFVYNTAGSNLIAIAIGNEPDLYHLYANRRDPDYVYADYKIEWEAYKAAVLSENAGIRFIGPNVSSSDDWLQSFISDEADNVDFLTMHYYPTIVDGIGSHLPTIENLLSKTLTNLTDDVIQTWVGYANAVSKPAVLGETQSCAHGGQSGVSDALVSALWAIDYAYNCLESGINKMFFHGLASDSIYAPITNTGIPRATYYALLFLKLAMPDGNCVTTQCTTLYNIVSHSVVGTDGKLRVTIVNKELVTDAYVQVSTQNIYSNATIQFLTGPSLDSTTGLTLCGAGVASDGTWSATDSDALTITNKTVNVTVPVGHAAVVIFSQI